jgi:soluble lytic murein transglycosylase-like protein
MPSKSRVHRGRKKKQMKWTTGIALVGIACLVWEILTSAPDHTPEVTAIPSNIATVIQGASDKYDVPKSLIEAIVAQESDMNPNAVSSAGAIGLMQLMPATAHSLGVANPFNPIQNIMGGTKYLCELLHRYHGNEKLALAAYNAGPKAVDKYKGVPPFPETIHYVQNVLAYETQYSKL